MIIYSLKEIAELTQTLRALRKSIIRLNLKQTRLIIDTFK